MPPRADMPSRRSIGARRSPETERAVLAAARQLLSDKGYAGFSVDDVARRANAGKPTIYRWWPTKADLFIAVYAEEKSAAVTVPDTGALFDDLYRYTQSLWRFWRLHPAGRTVCALIAEAQSSPAALAALREKFLPERVAPVRGIFLRAADRHEIAADEVEIRLQLWIGFNWFRLLTDDLGEMALASTMRAIVGRDDGCERRRL